MDPNANITEQRELATAIMTEANEGLPAQQQTVERLAELVIALSEWRKSGGFSPTDPLTISDAVTLGQILDASQKGQPVTWLARYPEGDLVGGGKTVSGTMRAICADDQGRGFINADKDVRDGYVWISATFEHFFPVREVIKWVKAGEMALNYRA